jgi:hypothetical protein
VFAHDRQPCRLDYLVVCDAEWHTLDLGFSPSTNLLPIRRLGLVVGQEAAVRAAWLGFPGLGLEPFEHRYRRTGARSYRYESASGRFVAELEANAVGFVTDYSGLWRAESWL